MFWVFLKKSCSSVTLQIPVTVQLFCKMKHMISTKIDFTIAFQNSSVQHNVGKEKRKNLYELSRNEAERFVRKGPISLFGWLKQTEEFRCLKDMGEFNEETTCRSVFSFWFLVFFPSLSSLLQEV